MVWRIPSDDILGLEHYFENGKSKCGLFSQSERSISTNKLSSAMGICQVCLKRIEKEKIEEIRIIRKKKATDHGEYSIEETVFHVIINNDKPLPFEIIDCKIDKGPCIRTGTKSHPIYEYSQKPTVTLVLKPNKIILEM